MSYFSGHLIKLYTSLHLSPHEGCCKREGDVIVFCHFTEIALYRYHSQKMTFLKLFLQILVLKASFSFALTECPSTQSRSQWAAPKLPCGLVMFMRFLWRFAKWLHDPKGSWRHNVCFLIEYVTNKFWNPGPFYLTWQKLGIWL